MKTDQRLTDTIVKGLPTPERGAKVHYDPALGGFGCRVTAAGARAFVLNYRTTAGRERRYTIGTFPSWKTAAARAFAADLKSRIRLGYDPLRELEADRAAPSMGLMCDRFAEQYLDGARLRPSTVRSYRMLIEGSAGRGIKGIRSHFKHKRVADVTHADIDELHRVVSRRAPYQANRMVALMSRMFGLAIRWGWRTDNPARGVERNHEVKRTSYLQPEEIARLTAALVSFPDQQAANIVRMLLLTGARKGEVLAARWDQIDLERGTWTKPGATTKQRTEHRAPLSAAARQLLAAIERTSVWVFPSYRRSEDGGMAHREDIKAAWARICASAGLVHADGKPTYRIHDLRHTYASVLASAGLSLPIIGALLGHTQPGTTARYAHLLDDPLRQATERVAVIVTGQPAADVVSIEAKR